VSHVFVDTSARGRGIDEAFAFDRHFEQGGFVTLA